MRLLVLGGTLFVGRAFVDLALERGHEISLFHRGMHGSDLFPQCEHILGDRTQDLEALSGRSWDGVLDTSGYLPSVVGRSARALIESTGAYVFVSSISVYRTPYPQQVDETAPLAELENPSVTEITGETYGGLKVLCEREVEAAFPGKATIVRPGIVAGPWDPTNRFTYWADHVPGGGRVLCPPRPDQPVQVIDVRDLGRFMLGAIESSLVGTFDVAGPTLSFAEMLDACSDGAGFQPVWASEQFLTEQGISLWQDLPLALDPSGESDPLMKIKSTSARHAGLAPRPVSETARDTRAWSSEHPVESPSHGLSREKERAALEASQQNELDSATRLY